MAQSTGKPASRSAGTAGAAGTVSKRSRLGRPPATTSAETRERIIRAARECFGRHGYDKTTNQLIARKAGITSGAIYHYFASKQDLFEAVTVETLGAVLDRFRAAAAPHASTVAKLRALLEEAVELHARDPSMAAFVSSSPIDIRRTEQLAPLAIRELTEMSRFYREIVDAGKARGDIVADADTTAIVHMLVATTSGIALYAAFAVGTNAHRATVRAFERLIDGTLIAPDGD